MKRLLNSLSKTIHGSKLKLKRLGYLDNRIGHISSLLEAINFDSIVGFLFSLVFYKLDIHTFLRTPRLAQLESGKAFQCVFEVSREHDRIANVSMSASAHPKGPLELAGGPLTVS